MQGDFRSFERQASKPSLVTQIAIGVFIGSLAASAVVWGVFEARVRWQLHQAETYLREQAERSAAQIRQSQDAARQRALAEQARRDAEVQRSAEAQRLEQESKRLASEAAQRKDEAWKRYYRPSPGCALAGQSMECSNEFIRAKRAFEAQYRPSAL